MTHDPSDGFVRSFQRRISDFGFRHSLVIRISSFVVRLLTLAIRAYQLVLSPAQALLFGSTGGCRFTPSCSRYAQAALREHGALAGSALAVRRICRCHPWCDGGYDPVPTRAVQPSDAVKSVIKIS